MSHSHVRDTLSRKKHGYRAGAVSGTAYVIGVGMTKFKKPGSRDWDYPDMAGQAGSIAPGRRSPSAPN